MSRNGGGKVKPENARKWRGTWQHLPDEEIIRRQALLKIPPKLCGFVHVVERNRMFKRLYNEGMSYMAIARHYGVDYAVVYRAVNVKIKARGRRRDLSRPKVPKQRERDKFTPARALAVAMAFPHMTTWTSLAKRFDVAKEWTIIRRMKDAPERDTINELFAQRKAMADLRRFHMAMGFREMCAAYNRVVTSRDIQQDGRRFGLVWHKVFVAFGRRRVMYRLCMLAGIDPKATRRQFWLKYLAPKPHITGEQS